MNNKIKKTVIFVDYNCNNNCIFCNQSHRRGKYPARTTSQIQKEMVLARKRGSTYLELIGGELSIRPDIFQLIRFARNLDFETIAMATNGRMYSYFDFTKKVIEAGLTDIIFSIHGHNSKLHDSLTQSPGSFQQLLKGLENFKKLNFKNIGSNTTVNKKNYKHLFKIGDFILKQGIVNSEFIFIDPTEGRAYDNFDKLVPRISEAAPYIQKCLAIGKSNNIPHWHIRYVPLCYFKDYLDRISELHETQTMSTEHIAPDFNNFDVSQSRKDISRTQVSQCKKCKFSKVCEGIWKEYINHYGSDELKPIL